MIVVFNCPQCRKKLRADDTYSGKKIQCRACKTILFVPGAPPVRQMADTETLADHESAEFVDSEDEVSQNDSARGDFRAAPDSEKQRFDRHDPSYGLASLYLATLSFFLFFTPAVLAGMTGAIGASIAFFAGLATNSGCFLLCWHGYRLAKRAEEMPGAQGYAEAGKIVNKFFLKFYALAFVFFLVGGILVVYFTKNAMGQIQNSLQGLEHLKGLDKVLTP